MEAIVFKDGVYVYVKEFNKNFIENESVASLIKVIIDDNKKHANLFGGRVIIKRYNNYSGCYIEIDGIDIIVKPLHSADGNMVFNQAAAYLTQMHTLGVDTFLANYKASLEKLKKELTEQADKLELDIERTKEVNNYMGYSKSSTVVELNNKLNHIRGTIISIIAILFNLSLNMNSGLDNHIYTEAYNYIINFCS